MKTAAPESHETIVEISHFNSDPFDNSRCTAKMNGASSNRIHFIADRHFSKDTPVYIRLKNGSGMCASGALGEEIRTAAVAWVKWSRRMEEGESPRYEIGVQYCR